MSKARTKINNSSSHFWNGIGSDVWRKVSSEVRIIANRIIENPIDDFCNYETRNSAIIKLKNINRKGK